MRVKFLSFGLAALLAVPVMATTFQPSATRLVGDNLGAGFVIQVNFFSTAAVNLVGCPAGSTAVFASAIAAGAFDLPLGNPQVEEDYIHDVGTLVVFDAAPIQAAIAAGETNVRIHMENTTNLGSFTNRLALTHADNLGVVRDYIAGLTPADFPTPGLEVEVMLEAMDLISDGPELGRFGIIRTNLTGGGTVNNDGDVFLGDCTGGGGSTLTLCLGPTGDARVIDEVDANPNDGLEGICNPGEVLHVVSTGDISAGCAAILNAQGPAINTFAKLCLPSNAAAVPVAIAKPVAFGVHSVDSRIDRLAEANLLFGGFADEWVFTHSFTPTSSIKTTLVTF